MDINAFISNLKVLADSSSDESVINKALISFEQNVCANLFSVLRNNHIQNVFKDVFDTLFNLSLHENTSIKLESSRAMSIFLTRLLPFYSELLQKSFSKVIEERKNQTPLVPASFAFMSKHVSQLLLLQYINITSIVDQFQVNDPCYAFIIDNIGHVGNGFLQYLLKKLIDQLNTDPNRHLFRAIGSVIKHSPSLFLPQILHLDFLALFAYIFLNIKFDYTKFDISHVIELVTKALQSEKSSPFERDCSYQIISTLSPEVTISQEDSNLIDVTFCDTEVTLDPRQNLDRPPFFLLPLPLKLLYPNENESVLILSAKFKTIAKNTTEENVNKVVSIFRKSLSLPYNEASSAAIIGFASQPKRLNSPELINMVIYKQSVSWFHSIDILRVIKSFQIVNVHTLNLLYEYIVSGNIKLRDESIETVKVLTKSETSDMIEQFFTQKVDFFDFGIFRPVMTTLISISGKSTNKSFLNFLSKTLLEVIDLYKDNVYFLTLVFDFFTSSKISNESSLIPVSKIAVALCEAYLSAIFGDTSEAESNHIAEEELNSQNQRKNVHVKIDFKHFLNHARKDVLSRNFDIINEDMSYGQFYPNFLATVRFIFSLPIYMIGANKAIDLASKIFTFFPNLCSAFYEKNWPNLDESSRISIFQSMFMKFQFISDSKTIAIWCRIALKMSQALKNPEVSKTIQSMNFTCTTLLTPNLIDMRSAAAFSAYLHTSNSEQHAKDIEIYISNLNEGQKTAFHGELSIIFENKIPPFFSDLLTSESRSEASDDDNSSQKAEEEDEEEILIDETGFNADMNRAILKGNSFEVVHLIQEGLKENVSFNLFEFCYPSSMKTEISKWVNLKCNYLTLKKLLSNHSDTESNENKEAQKKLTLLEMLELARTEWKQLLISYVNGHPSNSTRLLTDISNAPKARYNEILNISSIMAHVYFESSELFKLATRIAMHAEKPRKMRASYLFLAHAISIINRSNENGQFKPLPTHTYSISVPDSPIVSDLNSLLKPNTYSNWLKAKRFVIPAEFTNEYLSRIDTLFDAIPHREVALSLAQITANVQKVDDDFLAFCRKLLLAGSLYTQEVGLLCSIIITRYDELIMYDKSMTVDFESIVQNLLNYYGNADNTAQGNSAKSGISNLESLFAGLFGRSKSKSKPNPSNNNTSNTSARANVYISDACTMPSMLLSACRIVNTRKSFNNTLNPITHCYNYWHRIPCVNKMIIKTITRDVWHGRFRHMMSFYNRISMSMPEFGTILDFASFVLSSPELTPNKDDVILNRSFKIITQTIKNPTNRKQLDTALSSLVARLDVVFNLDDDKNRNNAVDVVIEWLNGLKEKDDPLALFFASDFAKILETKMDEQSLFALVAGQFIKYAPRFFTVFPIAAKYYLKFRKYEWATDIIKSSLQFLSAECHKKAIAYVIHGDIQIALKLCTFMEDCDESNKIIEDNPVKEEQQPPRVQIIPEANKREQQQQQQASKTRVSRPRSRTSRMAAPPE